MNNKYICIHGHFYQPPRENPWLEEVEMQDSAYPYHDWNKRVTAECYAPNTASRIIGPENKVVDILNNYSKMSFNFGPTLLSWMERHSPDIYAAILEADRVSAKKFSGHGSAIAQVFNHMIMPLANKRDKYTQVRWAIEDFKKRFGRMPEGMWLSETAADIETLEVLSEHEIKFTILSPYQAKRVRDNSSGEWTDSSGGKIDPRMPYLARLPSGRTISIFFYDGPIAQDVAFGGLLSNGENFARRLTGTFSENNNGAPQIAHIATDGETYGHHHKYGDMALGYCLTFIETNHIAQLTNYGEYLERFPPVMEVEIYESSSWSCPHGVERWRNGCGCSSGGRPQWNQSWRKPLREAMDGLRDILIPLFEREAAAYLKDPWQARDDYIAVINNRAHGNVNTFLRSHTHRDLAHDEKVTILKLLEMQRHAMLMYTSCGWFFDEISGIETVQVLQYASRAIQLAEELSGASLEPIYLKRLQEAPSNIPEFANGAKIYEAFAKPARVDFLRVGAHYSISSLFDEYSKNVKIYCYNTECAAFDKKTSGKLKRFIGKTAIISEITHESKCISSVVLHLGDHNINCGVQYVTSEDSFNEMHGKISEAFDRGDAVQVLKLIGKHFGSNEYSIVHLFRDEQRKVMHKMVHPVLDHIESYAAQVYENNYPLMNFFHNLLIPVPRALSMMSGYRINAELQRIFQNDGADIKKLQNLADEVKKWPLDIDRATLGFVAGIWVNAQMEKIKKSPEDAAIIENTEQALSLLSWIEIPLNLWETQNTYFSVSRLLYKYMQQKAQGGDSAASHWISAFLRLGKDLHIKV